MKQEGFLVHLRYGFARHLKRRWLIWFLIAIVSWKAFRWWSEASFWRAFAPRGYLLATSGVRLFPSGKSLAQFTNAIDSSKIAYGLGSIETGFLSLDKLVVYIVGSIAGDNLYSNSIYQFHEQLTAVQPIEWINAWLKQHRYYVKGLHINASGDYLAASLLPSDGLKVSMVIFDLKQHKVVYPPKLDAGEVPLFRRGNARGCFWFMLADSLYQYSYQSNKIEKILKLPIKRQTHWKVWDIDPTETLMAYMVDAKNIGFQCRSTIVLYDLRSSHWQQLEIRESFAASLQFKFINKRYLLLEVLNLGIPTVRYYVFDLTKKQQVHWDGHLIIGCLGRSYGYMNEYITSDEFSSRPDR